MEERIFGQRSEYSGGGANIWAEERIFVRRKVGGGNCLRVRSMNNEMNGVPYEAYYERKTRTKVGGGNEDESFLFRTEPN